MDIDALKKQLEQDDIKPVYFLYGDESYLVQKTVSTIQKKIVTPGFEGFNLQTFEGASFSYNNFETAYEALPMMAESKCVVLKDVNLEKLSKSDLDKFHKLLADLNYSTVLVIYFVNLQVDVKKSAKLKKICDIINKIGAVCEYSYATPALRRKIISEYCTRKKVKIQKSAVDRIITQCGKGYSVIFNELDKLIAYTQGREITTEDVKKLCISSVENDSFDLSNAILENNYEQAFDILDKLFYLRLEPVMIMGAINMAFIDMYRIKSAQINSLATKDVIKDFNYRSSYRLTKLYSVVATYSIAQIRSLIKILQKADVLLKSSPVDNRMIMEQMLGEMLEVASKRRMI